LNAISIDADAIPWNAWRLLVLSVRLTDDGAGNGAPAILLDHGGASRVSLAQWSKFLSSRTPDGVPMVCMQTVEIYLASQHLRVATLRSEEGKLKLRISIEDEG
jgi:hypothetical protein